MAGLKAIGFALAVAGAAWVGAAAPAAAGDDEHHNRWAGVYIGASVGGAWSNVDWTYLNSGGQSVNRDPSGTIAGVHFGIQTQWDHVVLGAEVSYSGDVASKIDSKGLDAPAFAANFDSYARIHNVTTIGPRLGWAFNNQWMAYATGGYANARVESAFILRANPFNATDSRSARQDGWFVGGGVEYALTSNFILGVDYKHIDLDTETHGPAVPVNNVTRDVSANIDVVTARLTFKLGLPDVRHEESMK